MSEGCHENGNDRKEQAGKMCNAIIARVGELLREDHMIVSYLEQMRADGFDAYMNFSAELVIDPTSDDYEKTKRLRDRMARRIASFLQNDKGLCRIRSDAEKAGVALFCRLEPIASCQRKRFVKDGKVTPDAFRDIDRRFLRALRVKLDDDPPPTNRQFPSGSD